jgi:flagella basal body P-ring formation protein FlgA
VTITNSEDRIKCFNKEFRMLFSGLKDRFPKGTTNCKLTVQQGSYSLSYPVRCRFSVQAPVVVTCLPIARGEIITSDKCTIQKRNITAFGPTPYTSIAALKNKRAARSLKPGTILHNRLLLTVPDIEKGDAVSIVLKKGRIAITVSGVARESGEIGDRIWVQNRNTRKLIRVEIRDKGIVEALQGGVSI